MAKYGSKDRIRQLEEAAGIESPVAETPNPMGPTPASGFTAAPYTGPRPWRGESTAPVTPAPGRSLLSRVSGFLSGADALKTMAPRTPTTATGGMMAATPTVGASGLLPLKSLRDRSTMGSPPFSKAELKQGYRKVGKGKK